MMFSPDVPVLPGRSRFTLWGGGHDGLAIEVRQHPDGTMPVLTPTNPDAVYVYRPERDRYEYERPAVQ